jgi:hypothetical protein
VDARHKAGHDGRVICANFNVVIPSQKPPKPARNNSIFVVHGRDAKLTTDMYLFLRTIDLNPIEWNDAIKGAKGGANPIVGDVIN